MLAHELLTAQSVYTNNPTSGAFRGYGNPQGTFANEQQMEELAGKAASFAVKIKEIAEPKPVELTDDLAKGQGFDDLASLKGKLREGIEREYGSYSRMRVKRALLDRLAESCKFEVPAGMVELEFDAIWQQIKQDAAAAGEGATG